MQRARLRAVWHTTALLLILGVLGAASADASGPRWVTGPPYFTGSAGKPVVWYTAQPKFYTDPGDLSASVDHAAADVLVAAAAGVWNVPTSAMVLTRGGALAEHVSAANTNPGSSGLAFPADVQPSNYAAKQIAVIYDSDGSVTDLLLGAGASAPAECRQNAVTESVDSITPAGFIQHAVLVLNGRCTGPAPEQQQQMQYQLERAFGRVLGVGWSQTNDNVFTGVPQPTYNQATHWPIMHPIDIVCGAYTYHCLPEPFRLRDDDVAAISTLYPSGSIGSPGSSAPGKIWSYTQASRISGNVTFPTGQGMQGVNVVVRRQQGGWNTPEAWDDVSSVSGFAYQQNGGNPATGASLGVAGSMGSTDAQREGFYDAAWIPNIDPDGTPHGGMFVVVSTEAINPLYTGAHAVGPFVVGGISPSGAPQSQLQNRHGMDAGSWESWDLAPGDAAGRCDTGGDGVETQPLPVAADGWWSGVLCAHGHAAWSSLSGKAGRTATLEVAAQDESGLATTTKAMPLIGVWHAGDDTGMLPTVAASSASFNTIAPGTTAVSVAMTEALRFVIADARGGGRPDFGYTARVLYADAVEPASTSVNGGQIVIGGMGFRAGNQVLVNGVTAEVSSWTATQIVAVAPPRSAFPQEPGGPVDIAVLDPVTGGTTAISAGLTYSASVAPDTMALVSAPSGTVAVGSVVGSAFEVRVTLPDGVTPVVAAPVTFSATTGSVLFGVCGRARCIVLTNTNGVASTSVTPMGFGGVTLRAAGVGASQTAAFVAVAHGITATQPVEYVAAGESVLWTPQVNVVENGAPAGAVAVDWSAATGLTLSSVWSVSNALGEAEIGAVIGPLTAGVQATGQACAWTTVCTQFSATGVDPAEWQVAVTSGAGQVGTSPKEASPVRILVTDASGHPVAGARVAVHQAVDAGEVPCPARGRCPVAPPLAATTTTGFSDTTGLVSVTPMQSAVAGGVTKIAVAAGTQGFSTLSLAQQP